MTIGQKVGQAFKNLDFPGKETCRIFHVGTAVEKCCYTLNESLLCSNTGRKRIISTRFVVKNEMSIEEIEWIIFKTLIFSAAHEAMEFIKKDGEKYFDPHGIGATFNSDLANYIAQYERKF